MSSKFFSKYRQTRFGKFLYYFSKYTLSALVIASIVSIGVFSGIFFAYIDTAGELSAEQLKIKDSKTILYDINNKEFESIYGSENREWVNIDKIPAHLKQAFIAIEDERFYRHNGIDIRRIFSAIISAIKPGEKVHGASTITQQLVKNLTGEREVTLKRKIQEQWRAIQLEKKLTKEQILELYLNIVPLSNGINGVQAAAKTFFGKDVSELTLAECASIAGITKYPVYYDPLKNPENNKKRQEDVLFKMKQLGYITEEEYEQAINEKLVFKKSAIERVINHSYFTDQVINDVVRDLQLEKGYSKSIAEKLIYGGGLKIYTTVDSRIQKAMEDYYSNPNNFIHTNSKEQPQSAMVILDPESGQVRGIVGGIGPKQGKRILNRATQCVRQPGSSIKPLSVYAPAIEKGKITPNTIVSDTPLKIGDWEPHNYDNSFMGNITVRTAVAKSRNIPAVRILQKVGLDDSYAFLKIRFGISSLKPADKDYAPLSLGALSEGVSPLEMAAAYATFCNGGIYIKPYTYLRVIDSEGNVLLDNSTIESRAVITEHTAYIMTELLKGVVTSGTGTLARLNNMPAAGKTGTTSDMHDKWFIGYTPYYVGVVWYGYDTPQYLPEATWNSALIIWKNVMEKVHQGLPYKEFRVPEEFMIEVPICTVSGKRATSLCYKDIEGSKVKIVKFIKGTEPTNYCDVHKEVTICKVSGKLATPYCPASQIEKKSIVLTGEDNETKLQKCDIHPPNAGANEQNENISDENLNKTLMENKP